MRSYVQHDKQILGVAPYIKCAATLKEFGLIISFEFVYVALDVARQKLYRADIRAR